MPHALHMLASGAHFFSFAVVEQRVCGVVYPGGRDTRQAKNATAKGRGKSQRPAPAGRAQVPNKAGRPGLGGGKGTVGASRSHRGGSAGRAGAERAGLRGRTAVTGGSRPKLTPAQAMAAAVAKLKAKGGIKKKVNRQAEYQAAEEARRAWVE